MQNDVLFTEILLLPATTTDDLPFRVPSIRSFIEPVASQRLLLLFGLCIS